MTHLLAICLVACELAHEHLRNLTRSRASGQRAAGSARAREWQRSTFRPDSAGLTAARVLDFSHPSQSLLEVLVMRRFVLPAVLVITVSGLASAAPKGKNVGDAEKWRESEELLRRNDKSATAACGTNLSISYDSPSFGDLSLEGQAGGRLLS